MIYYREPKEIISQHRLPQPYRTYLIIGWSLPVLLLFGATIILNDAPFAVFQPNFLLLFGIMLFPAWYCWQTGVDIYQSGMKCRVHLPNYYRYHEIEAWQVKKTEEGDILCVYKYGGQTILSYHMAHLSDARNLMHALREYVDQPISL